MTWNRRTQILFFALKLIGSFAVAAILSVVLAGTDIVTYWLRFHSLVTTGIWTLAVTFSVAWVLAPAGLTLLNSGLTSPLPAESKRSARIACVSCSVASAALSLVLLVHF